MTGPPAADRLRLALERAAWRLQPHDPHPLVSIVIATYNRGWLLVERTIPSLLRQTYPRWEAVIVGDACTDDTGNLLARVADPRLRFQNLPSRGVYPEDPLQRWMVAGCAPMNRALELARGDWLAYIDDDDVFTEDHIAVLLEHALASRAEFAYGAGEFERSPGEWLRIGGFPPEPGKLMHSSVLYRRSLRFLRYDVTSWKWSLGADAHLWMRMKALGVRFAFLDRVVCRAPLRPGETLAGQRAAESRRDAAAPQGQS